MKGISIIICCYNSSTRIKPTLSHIYRQEKTEAIKWEIILVDNNSKDETAKIAKEYWSSLDIELELIIIAEKNPGLSFARLKGIENSKYNLVLFCDDDNWLAPDYVYRAYNFMESNIKVGMLGGTGYPVIDSQEPNWFQNFTSLYAVGKQGLVSGDITFTKGYVYGAGAVIRKKVYQRIRELNIQFLLTGRKSNVLSSGEDNEIGYCIAFSGYQIYYDENLKFKHFIPPERLTLDYIKRMRIGYGYTYDIIKCYQSLLHSKGSIRRTKKTRYREYIVYARNVFKLLLLKLSFRSNIVDFIFGFYSSFYLLREGLIKWNENLKNEKVIFENYQKLNQMKNINDGK
jgi:glycosyltransferase involved in cell wall biosynthesis